MKMSRQAVPTPAGVPKQPQQRYALTDEAYEAWQAAAKACRQNPADLTPVRELAKTPGLLAWKNPTNGQTLLHILATAGAEQDVMQHAVRLGCDSGMRNAGGETADMIRVRKSTGTDVSRSLFTPWAQRAQRRVAVGEKQEVEDMEVDEPSDVAISQLRRKPGRVQQVFNSLNPFGAQVPLPSNPFGQQQSAPAQLQQAAPAPWFDRPFGTPSAAFSAPVENQAFQFPQSSPNLFQSPGAAATPPPQSSPFAFQFPGATPTPPPQSSPNPFQFPGAALTPPPESSAFSPPAEGQAPQSSPNPFQFPGAAATPPPPQSSALSPAADGQAPQSSSFAFGQDPQSSLGAFGQAPQSSPFQAQLPSLPQQQPMQWAPPELPGPFSFAFGSAPQPAQQVGSSSPGTQASSRRKAGKRLETGQVERLAKSSMTCAFSVPSSKPLSKQELQQAIQQAYGGSAQVQIDDIEDEDALPAASSSADSARDRDRDRSEAREGRMKVNCRVMWQDSGEARMQQQQTSSVAYQEQVATNLGLALGSVAVEEAGPVADVDAITLKLDSDSSSILCGACLLYNADGGCEKVVCYNDREFWSGAVRHSGDTSVDGKSVHTVSLVLSRLPDEVSQLYFTLCSCGPADLSGFKEPSIMLYQNSQPDANLIEYSIQQAEHSQSVVMAKMMRQPLWRAGDVKLVSRVLRKLKLPLLCVDLISTFANESTFAIEALGTAAWHCSKVCGNYAPAKELIEAHIREKAAQRAARQAAGAPGPAAAAPAA